MTQISLVTARAVRQNAQYTYKLKGKGEQYLVIHEDGENAGDKVLEYLTPYVVSPVTIEAIKLQKNVEFVNEGDVKDHIYKCVVEYVTLNDKSGKETRVRKPLYVFGNDVRDALHGVEESFGMEADVIKSISLTKIIELL